MKKHICGLAIRAFSQGRLEEALSYHRKALEVDSNTEEALNGLAWILATAQDAKLRNPQDAIRYASKACALTGFQEPQYIDTLAAAYAAAGAGATGTVVEVGIFTTVLNSLDNTRITIPNSQVTGNSIRNYTVNGTRRVDIVVGVSYEDDLRKAQQVIERVLVSDSRVLSEPAPTVVVSELGDSSVNFIVRPWVKADDYWSAFFDLTAKVKLALDENNITIPYPQRDIHIKSGTIAGLAK